MKPHEEPQFDFSGGALCLDFINCINGSISDYSGLLAWARQAGLIERKSLSALRREAAGRPRRAAYALGRAKKLRVALFSLFAAIAAGRDPDERMLETFNRFLGKAVGHLRLENSADGPRWSWKPGDEELEQLLWPVAWSAAELLTSPGIERITECNAAGCRWLFLDRSRNHSRRWCDMKTCGNRTKARRHYLKTKKATSAAR